MKKEQVVKVKNPATGKMEPRVVRDPKKYKAYLKAQKKAEKAEKTTTAPKAEGESATTKVATTEVKTSTKTESATNAVATEPTAPTSKKEGFFARRRREREEQKAEQARLDAEAARKRELNSEEAKLSREITGLIVDNDKKNPVQTYKAVFTIIAREYSEDGDTEKFDKRWKELRAHYFSKNKPAGDPTAEDIEKYNERANSPYIRVSNEVLEEVEKDLKASDRYNLLDKSGALEQRVAALEDQVSKLKEVASTRGEAGDATDSTEHQVTIDEVQPVTPVAKDNATIENNPEGKPEDKANGATPSDEAPKSNEENATPTDEETQPVVTPAKTKKVKTQLEKFLDKIKKATQNGELTNDEIDALSATVKTYKTKDEDGGKEL